MDPRNVALDMRLADEAGVALKPLVVASVVVKGAGVDAAASVDAVVAFAPATVVTFKMASVAVGAANDATAVGVSGIAGIAEL